MDTSEIAVLLGGIALIGLILWYFFGRREKVEAVVNDTGPMHLAAACGAPTLALLHAPEGARFAHRDPLFAALVWPDVPQALAAASRLLDTAQAAREPPPSSQEHHR